MKKLLPVLALAVLACSQSPEIESGVQYGAALSDMQTTPITQILAAPENYEKKTVQVVGTIDAVCQMQGCWIDLRDDATQQRIRVKVEDGEIIFPEELKGKRARVEGIVEKIEMTAEEHKSHAEHEAAERGEAYHPEEASGAKTEYRIWGLGAIVAE